MKFLDNVGDPSYASQCPCPIVYATFRSEDIRHYVSKSSKNWTNVNVSWPYFFWRRPQLFYSRLLARFTIRRLASVVEFCLLISVCEACMAMTYRKQNLHIVLVKMAVQFEAVW